MWSVNARGKMWDEFVKFKIFVGRVEGLGDGRVEKGDVTWIDGWRGGWMDGLMDGLMDGWMG